MEPWREQTCMKCGEPNWWWYPSDGCYYCKRHHDQKGNTTEVSIDIDAWLLFWAVSALDKLLTICSVASNPVCADCGADSYIKCGGWCDCDD